MSPKAFHVHKGGETLKSVAKCSGKPVSRPLTYLPYLKRSLSHVKSIKPVSPPVSGSVNRQGSGKRHFLVDTGGVKKKPETHSS